MLACHVCRVFDMSKGYRHAFWSMSLPVGWSHTVGLADAIPLLRGYRTKSPLSHNLPILPDPLRAC